MINDDTLTIRVSGDDREISFVHWHILFGPRPPKDFENNGCSYSPDSVRDYQIWPACVIHDWHYSGRVEDMDQRRADKTFRRNLWRSLRYQGAPWPLASWITTTRYFAVTKFGDLAFNEYHGEKSN